jgi:peptidoglycan/LPS O-acetylase OafA/YrhL
MTLKGFFKRRLIRLHPMIIMGMIVGAATFYFQDGGWFGNIHLVPVWKMLLVMVIGFTLIPVPVSMDVRGWAEMHPLDGPAWSLFFEYVGNILYALFVRKFSKTLLAILVAISGAALIHLAVTSPRGDVIGGWSLTPEQLRVGFTRLMYPFFAGLLLSRIVKVGTIKNAFMWSSLLIIAVFSIPRIGGSEHPWMNGLYDSLSIILVFPIVVYIGASGELKGKFASKLCKFLGDISYPIYITHYPLIYIYTGYVTKDNLPISQSYPAAILLFVSSIALAYASLRFYDVPVRAWLTKRFMDKKAA